MMNEGDSLMEDGMFRDRVDATIDQLERIANQLEKDAENAAPDVSDVARFERRIQRCLERRLTLCQNEEYGSLWSKEEHGGHNELATWYLDHLTQKAADLMRGLKALKEMEESK